MDEPGQLVILPHRIEFGEIGNIETDVFQTTIVRFSAAHFDALGKTLAPKCEGMLQINKDQDLRHSAYNPVPTDQPQVLHIDYKPRWILRV